MPAGMMLAAHQRGDPNLRRAANTYSAGSPIFLTQATEAEKATAEIQQRKRRMKKRLNDILHPPHAVLSHALSPAKLYRSLSQARRNGGKLKRHSKVSLCYVSHVPPVITPLPPAPPPPPPPPPRPPPPHPPNPPRLPPLRPLTHTHTCYCCSCTYYHSCMYVSDRCKCCFSGICQ